MRKRKAWKPDVVLKEYWRNPVRFAELFNQVLFGGKKVLLPEELTDDDTDLSVCLEDGHGILHTVERYRDLVKKSAGGVEFVVYCIENQMNIHYAMPLRCYLYDALDYVGQCKEIAGRHRGMGGLNTAEEFLSGMKKNDRLKLTLTIVIYYGEKAWDGPKCLSDMVEVDEAFKPFFNNYSMILIEAADACKYDFSDGDVKMFFQLLAWLYEKNNKTDKKKLMEDELKERVISRDILLAVVTASGDKKLVDMICRREGEMTMCTFFEELRSDWLEEGMEKGMEQGERRVNELIQILCGRSRGDEILRMANDMEYQKKLFEEFGL